jgi:transposase
MENDSEVLSGLVLARLRDGRCCYDPQVKQELVRRCLQPGVSVAGMAMQNVVNANQLSKWITQQQSRNAIAVQIAAPQDPSAFLAVQLSGAPIDGKAVAPRVPVAPSHPDAQPMHLRVQLPNGVAVDLGATQMQDLLLVMQSLYSLPCSR